MTSNGQQSDPIQDQIINAIGTILTHKHLNTNFSIFLFGVVAALVFGFVSIIADRIKSHNTHMYTIANDIRLLDLELQQRLTRFKRRIYMLIELRPHVDAKISFDEFANILEAADKPSNVGLPRFREYHMTAVFDELAERLFDSGDAAMENRGNAVMDSRYRWQEISDTIEQMKLAKRPLGFTEYLDRESRTMFGQNLFGYWILRQPLPSAPPFQDRLIYFLFVAAATELIVIGALILRMVSSDRAWKKKLMSSAPPPPSDDTTNSFPVLEPPG